MNLCLRDADLIDGLHLFFYNICRMGLNKLSAVKLDFARKGLLGECSDERFLGGV